MTALPSSFGAVLRYGTGALTPSLRLMLRMREAPQEAGIVYDALFVDEQDRVRLEMRHCEGTLSAALNRLGGQAATTKTQTNASACSLTQQLRLTAQNLDRKKDIKGKRGAIRI